MNVSRFERLLERMSVVADRLAFAEGDVSYCYADLLDAVERKMFELQQLNIKPGSVYGVQAEFGFRAIVLVLALFRHRCVVALLSPAVVEVDAWLEDAQAEGWFRCGGDEPVFQVHKASTGSPLLQELANRGEPGFVIFSSGSSGKPKAILHSLNRFLVSYERPNKSMTTLAFLLFDHIAGLDTLFYTLHAGGALVLTGDRGPLTVCRLIERWRIQVLPVSPSFLKLLCISDATEGRDLESLRVITYGSEPMDPSTLQRVADLFPNVALRQKYGASEFGAPAAKTRVDTVDGGLWIRLDSEQVKVRVEDGVLWLLAPTTMCGYLNAEMPDLRDGWFCTGDRVEVDGLWLRILGRESDLINVGGEKVFPSEVEAVIKELDWVAEVAVAGEANPMLGQVVKAVVRPRTMGADVAELRSWVRRHCTKRLSRHKVPTRIVITDKSLTGARQKTLRQLGGDFDV